MGKLRTRKSMPSFQLLAQPAENHEELSARQHIADQLERRFIPRPLCKSSLIAEFNSELKILKEAVHSGSGEYAWDGLTLTSRTKKDPFYRSLLFLEPSVS